jgi:hypothetical protein
MPSESFDEANQTAAPIDPQMTKTKTATTTKRRVIFAGWPELDTGASRMMKNVSEAG